MKPMTQEQAVGEAVRKARRAEGFDRMHARQERHLATSQRNDAIRYRLMHGEDRADVARELGMTFDSVNRIGGGV